jgi:NADPH-dependent 2,4-dienoyl-CoA reductase/sulfur reductase-like enzyme
LEKRKNTRIDRIRLILYFSYIQENRNMKLVIVGGVAAGATAAARARRLDENAEITIVERGPYVSFANCGLPYRLSGDIQKRSSLILQTPEGFFSRYRVKVLLKTEAVAIDRDSKLLKLRSPEVKANSPTIPHPRPGRQPLRAPVEGIDFPNVVRLWTIRTWTP